MAELLHQSATYAARHAAERRREPRMEAERPVCLQPADASGEAPGEACAMTNFSRDGFYFETGHSSYRRGMHLHCVPSFGCLNLEYLGRVVRVDLLEPGRFGVAVKLLRVRNQIGKYQPVSPLARPA